MPSIDDVFESNTLKAADIKGREVTVTIASVEKKEFAGRDNSSRQNKLLIKFERAKKAFVCNRTNSQRIAYAYGKDYNLWVGKQITLYVDPFVQFGNELVEAIRVKPPATVGTPRPAPQSPEEVDPMPDNTFKTQPAPRKPAASYNRISSGPFSDDPLADDRPFNDDPGI